MFKTFLFSALLTLPTVAPTFGQDWYGMLERDSQAQRQYIQQTIVQPNMQNPRIQAMYQQHLQAGGRMSLQEFAYYYGATAGFTPQGKAFYQQSEHANQRRVMDSYHGLLRAQEERARAQGALADGYHNIQHERGNLLQGRSTYIDAYGRPIALPHTLYPNTYHHDYQTGRNFWYGEDNNYYEDE